MHYRKKEKMRVRLTAKNTTEGSLHDMLGNATSTEKVRYYRFDFIHKDGYQISAEARFSLVSPWRYQKRYIINALTQLKDAINKEYPDNQENRPYLKFKGLHCREIEI